MKLIVLSLFSLLVLLSSIGHSQKLPSQKISIDVRNQTLANILTEMEQKSGIKFSYNPRKIESDRKINFTVVNKTVDEALKELSKSAALQYAFVENQIILTPQNKSEVLAEQQAVTYSGYVNDATNGEALIGATIYIKELQSGTVTNSYGFFSITLPKGMYEITISYIGFKTLQKTIDLQNSMRDDLPLAEDLPVLKEIVVTAQPEESVSETQVSNLHLRPKAVEERPARAHGSERPRRHESPQRRSAELGTRLAQDRLSFATPWQGRCLRRRSRRRESAPTHRGRGRRHAPVLGPVPALKEASCALVRSHDRSSQSS